MVWSRPYNYNISINSGMGVGGGEGFTMKQPSPGYQRVPRCLKRMLPGTTYWPSAFLEPRRLPAVSLGPLARPWAWWEACRRFEGRSAWGEMRKLERADSRADNAAIDGTRGERWRWLSAILVHVIGTIQWGMRRVVWITR